MKIDLNNGMLHIDLTQENTSTNKIYKMYIDSIYNKDYTSTFDEEHDKVINEEYTLDSVLNIDVTDSPRKAYILTIFLHEETTMTDSQIVYFVVDDEWIYYNIVNMLICTCNHCVSKTWKEKTLLCWFRYELLKHAIADANIKDCIYLYKDLLRILGLDDRVSHKYVGNDPFCDCKDCGKHFCHSCCHNDCCDSATFCGCHGCFPDCCSNSKWMFNNLHRWIDVV